MRVIDIAAIIIECRQPASAVRVKQCLAAPQWLLAAVSPLAAPQRTGNVLQCGERGIAGAVVDVAHLPRIRVQIIHLQHIHTHAPRVNAQCTTPICITIRCQQHKTNLHGRMSFAVTGCCRRSIRFDPFKNFIYCTIVPYTMW